VLIDPSLTRSFIFACPVCHVPLQEIGEQAFKCPNEGTTFPKISGIWRFLSEERSNYFKQFIQDYETVRSKEQRGSTDPLFYRSLPYRDLTGRWQKDWNIRSRSYQALLQKVVKPFEASTQQPLRILDIGAGNGWLSYRLSLRGHRVAAIDLLINKVDGLGAFIHYDSTWIPIQAEMDALPLSGNQVDLIIYNASFHYSSGYANTLKEAVRVLIPGGRLVIMDSPVYHDPRSGIQMVNERETYFTKQYGFPSNAIPSESYLTFNRLEDLGLTLGLQWRIFKPYYGLRWHLRPWWSRVKGGREPAQFLLIMARAGVS
jgi:SAM-dependent methyltransferase